MTIDLERRLGTLTEKEKQTLRLMVRGHDAKSIARTLDLSIHTINERLRFARRKVAVSSSREAARLLFEAEGGEPDPDHQSVGDEKSGDAPTSAGVDGEGVPIDGAAQTSRPRQMIPGVVSMTFALALFAVLASPQSSTAPPAATADAAEMPDPAVIDTARQWLAMLDRSDWAESYRMTGAAFRQLNTEPVWAAASDRVRVPLGAMVSRTLIGEEDVPAPPMGYQVVKFRTTFANKPHAVETVTLNREDGSWRVVGVTVG